MSKQLLTLVAAGLIAAFGGIGCNKSPEGGVTGTKNSFKVTAPTLPLMLKQGDKQTVTVTLDRESGFQQTVKLDAQAPKGLKADFDMKSVKASDAKDVSLSITADKDAALGDHVVKVTATPDTGSATTVDIKVTVTLGAR